MKNTPSKTAPTSIRLSRTQSATIDKMAAKLDRSRSWVIAAAVDAYIDIQKEHIAAIEEGIRQADAGMGVSHEQAVKNFRAFRKTRRLSPLRAGRAKTRVTTRH
jgi:predicted transcriptional regulator